VVAEEGIPLAWVPRKAIVATLVGAGDRATRMRIIMAHTAEIIEDCELCLAECKDTDLTDVVQLAERVITAVKDGHNETAQALAVVLAEALITQYVVAGPTAGSYKKAAQIARFSDDVDLSQLRWAFTIAPIPRFYTEWFPERGTPSPTELSRHASVHHPSLNQYTTENGLLSLLLLVSLLRGVTEIKKLAGL
jgi:hypothetical protein